MVEIINKVKKLVKSKNDKPTINELIREINKLEEIAKSVHENLRKNKYSKARNGVEEIIILIKGEMKRIKKVYGKDKLIKECKKTLNKAKQVLIELEHSEHTNDSKKLIDDIIKIENNILREIKERKDNELFQFWYNEIHNAKVYHIIDKIILEKVKHFGLSPNISPIDSSDLMKVNRMHRNLTGHNIIGLNHESLYEDSISFFVNKNDAKNSYITKEIVNETIDMFILHIDELEEKIVQGKTKEVPSDEDRMILKELKRHYKEMKIKKERNITLSIDIKENIVMKNLDKELRKIVLDYKYFKEIYSKLKKELDHYRDFLNFIHPIKINERIQSRVLKIED